MDKGAEVRERFYNFHLVPSNCGILRLVSPILIAKVVDFGLGPVDGRCASLFITSSARTSTDNISASNDDEIRSRTGQPILSDTVRSRRLSFFGLQHCTNPSQDHHRALQACIMGSPDDWRRRIGRPRQSWLRTVEADLRPMNLALATSKRRAVRPSWRKLIATATSTTSS